MIKRCKLCGEDKPLTAFYLCYNKWTEKRYPGSRCRACHETYRKTNPKTPETAKKVKLQLRYGLTLEQWAALRARERHSCMICQTPELELGRKLNVDHCHASGKVRGVLCNHCNTMLGMAKDKPSILRTAAQYIETNANGYSGYESTTEIAQGVDRPEVDDQVGQAVEQDGRAVSAGSGDQELVRCRVCGHHRSQASRDRSRKAVCPAARKDCIQGAPAPAER